MTLTIIQNKLDNAGLGEVYSLVLQQALAQIALTDREFAEILELKVLYSLKTEMINTEIDSDFILNAVKAHEDYLLYLKRNNSEIVKTVLSVLNTTVGQIA